MCEVQFPSSYAEQLQRELHTSIDKWYEELSSLLPSLPKAITVEFDNDYLVSDYGTGGAAWTPSLLKLAYDPDFDAPAEELMAELRAAYFHEGYHLARGVSIATTPYNLPALTNAIEEGLATKFEMVAANSKPGYGQYEDRDTMFAWFDEVKSLPDGFNYDWERWKFFDPPTGRRWILYKVGSFIVDEVLKNDQNLTIEVLADISADEILNLSRL